MIVQENLGNGIIRTYSNAGFKVHGGFPVGDYDISYDPEDANREFTETDIPVDHPISEYLEPDKPKQYSKVKILLAAQEAGFVESLIGFIESDKTIEYIWNASNVIEDNELLAAYIPAIAQALGREETNIREFLDAYCVVDNRI